MDESAVRQLKVAELKSELQKLDLSVAGKKEELQNRLIEALATTKSKPNDTQVNTTTTTTTAITGNKKTFSVSPTSPKSPTGTNTNNANKGIAENNKVPDSTSTDETDKKSVRAARFNLPPGEDERKRQRSERFGVDGTEEFLDDERVKSRQARFGGTTTNSVLLNDDFEAAKIRRLERFGLTLK